MQVSPSASAPAPTSVLFARGVIARLAIWPALRAAVAENWGGPNGAEKRTWLASVIVDAFEEVQNPSPDVYYVEDMLLQIMSDEYETVLEDGSAEGVAWDIVKLWEEVQNGKADMVLNLEQRADKIKGNRVEIQQGIAEDEEEEWSDDDDEMDDGEEAPQLLPERPPRLKEEPQVDDEGFTLVTGKNRKR